ncbi:MAG: hypothetical protein AUF67_00010 [Acidobacteria bacterium 13_1_20CM_58_21]|nr:MAG: hypothetical protein AUF67_00010 [Acidobacteria bacterium 13_1_20CM_58_21]
MNFTARFLGTRIVALVASLLCCPGAFSGDQSADETAIRNVEIRQQEAWNHHDAKAYASLFSQDADVVNVVGWWWKSRSELESKLARAHAFLFRESTLTITDVQIKFPAPNFAVAHVSWTMVGAKSPDGNPVHLPQKGVQTQFLMKRAGEWLITAFQNVNSVPEIPFPLGPPAAPRAEVKSETPLEEPTVAEMSRKETIASALLRGLQSQEYQARSAAEAMPEEKYGYRPAEGKFKDEKPDFGPAEVRTFAEQVKHVACANFAFAAELDGQRPPGGCDKGGPSPAKTKKELLIYLRDSFAAIRKSLGVIGSQNMFDPIEGPYAGPNTRLGLATVVIWHNADHYGQMTLHLRLNGIVPPASLSNPPKVKDTY